MISTSPPRLSLHGHLLLPLVVFIITALMVELANVDVWLADRIYALSGNSWALRDNWFTRDVIHEGGRLLTGIMVICLFTLTIASNFITKLRPLRRGLCYLAVSTVACGLVINLLKELTHLDCPWDLLRYGGEFPYVRNFERHPDSFRFGACFPAGHASAAYAWIGLYFCAHRYALCLKWKIFFGVDTTGLIFGIGQQLRGAHFLSHDIWTFGLCWFLSTTLYLAFFHDRTSIRPQEIQIRNAAAGVSFGTLH